MTGQLWELYMTTPRMTSSLHIPILQTCCHPPHLVYTIMVMGLKSSHRLGNSYSSWATSLVWGIQICGWIAAHSSRKLGAPTPMSTLCILPIQQHILLPAPALSPSSHFFISTFSLSFPLTAALAADIPQLGNGTSPFPSPWFLVCGFSVLYGLWMSRERGPRHCCLQSGWPKVVTCLVKFRCTSAISLGKCHSKGTSSCEMSILRILYRLS